MRSTTITIVLLALLLVATNAWWAYQLFDAGVSLAYRDASVERHRLALVQALAVMPVLARPGHTRSDVLAAARAAAPEAESFEKEGYVWVGRLGLSFDPSGRRREAVPAWEPF